MEQRERNTLPIINHSSFIRPPISSRLWRYIDFPKFVHLLTSKSLWLSNLEKLAEEDPYEGLPGEVLFPHRLWKSIGDVPSGLRTQILQIYNKLGDLSEKEAFEQWFKLEEQACYMTLSNRRNFYVNCWHAAEHESVAMWKIYASPGTGVAVLTNGGRLGAALEAEPLELHLGAVQYRAPGVFTIGMPNVFDPVVIKSGSYSYEQEVRLVHWDHSQPYHDPLKNFQWNEEKLRFEDVITDDRVLIPGRSVACDVITLVEKVIVSPFAPPWYLQMIEDVRDQLGFKFPVVGSTITSIPKAIP